MRGLPAEACSFTSSSSIGLWGQFIVHRSLAFEMRVDIRRGQGCEWCGARAGGGEDICFPNKKYGLGTYQVPDDTYHVSSVGKAA